MVDQINKLAQILSRRHSFKVITKHLSKIILYLGIVKYIKDIDTGYLHRRTPECTFFCKINKEKNIFKENIEIIIKPDHSEKRVLRVVIQKGRNIIYQEKEDRDNPHWADSKVFKKEESKAEEDILRILKKIKKAA